MNVVDRLYNLDMFNNLCDMGEGMKTTEKDFELFKKECQKWVDYFGLHGWDIFYKHKQKEDCFGCIDYDTAKRNAVIYLSIEWEDEYYSPEKIRETAFHEICELLFARIKIINLNRFVGDDEMDEEIHNIIRILENKVFS